jgi:VWFA-related protein
VLHRSSAFVALAIYLVLTALADNPAAQRGSSTSIPRVSAVYVSAVGRSGSPVADLTATDVVLKEGGDTREIIKVERATAPMQVAIIIDDSGTGIFRYAVGKFVDQLLGHAHFAIRRVVGQVRSIVDYTSDVEQLRNAVLALKVIPETPEGGQVVEAVSQAAKELQSRDAQRPVIIVLTDTEAEYSSLPAEHVLEQLRESGATLYVISIAKVQERMTLPGPASIVPGAQSTVEKPSDLLDRQIDINRVLGDGPKQSGGRRAEINSSAGPIPALQEIAEELNHQYLITYIVPAGEKLDQKISVSSRRRGVSLRAPSRAGRGIR